MVLEGLGIKGTWRVEFDYKYTESKNLGKTKMTGGSRQGRRAVVIGEKLQSVLRETETEK